MKKIREYFKGEIGPWADMISDEALDELVAGFLKQQNQKPTVSVDTYGVNLDEVKRDVEASKTYVSPGSGLTNINASNIQQGYVSEKNFVPSVEMDAQFYGANLIVKDLSFDFKLQTYSATVVKDYINPNNEGRVVKGYYKSLKPVEERGVIIQNGRTIYAREYQSNWFNQSGDEVQIKNSAVKGHETFIMDAPTYKSIKWDIFPKGDVAAVKFGGVNFDESSDNKFIRVYAKKFDPNYTFRTRLMTYAKAAFDAQGNRLK